MPSFPCRHFCYCIIPRHISRASPAPADADSHSPRWKTAASCARQARAARQRAEQGKVPKGVRLTGYTLDGEVVETEATIVREIFARFYAGDSLKGIARYLNETGVKTRHGKLWNPSTVSSILRNPRYCGRVYYNRREHFDGNGRRGARNRKTRSRERPREEWIPIPVPPIVDRDTFARVKQVSRDNSRWSPRGKCMRCRPKERPD